MTTIRTHDLQTWAEIDLDAYRDNIVALKGLTTPDTLFMAVVKADAYGHGAAELARVAAEAGADWLGVARIDEALDLRHRGLTLPILIFGSTPASRIDELLEHDLVQTVFDWEMAESLARVAADRGRHLRTHLKIDTGMGRLGLPWLGAETTVAASEVVDDIGRIANLDGLSVEGIFTHFANADQVDTSDAIRQLERFHDLLGRLQSGGIDIPLRHAANSAALLALPASHLDMVRAGIATYGLYPAAESRSTAIDLRPVLGWKARIIQLKNVPADFAVSYGSTYRTPRPTTLATVAVGYADGLDRLLSSTGRMLVGGRPAAIAGRICMDLTVLDLGPDADARVGDEAVIIGRQGEAEISVDTLASAIHTINYEIVTSITARVPRIYLR